MYVECQSEGVLDPRRRRSNEGRAHLRRRAAGLESPVSAWYALVMRLELDSTRYLQLLVRPEGVGTFNRVRAAVSDTGIDVGYEPIFGIRRGAVPPPGANAMKRRETEDVPFSLDSFLDIVTNVVGVLVLVAIVTVLSAGEHQRALGRDGQYGREAVGERPSSSAWAVKSTSSTRKATASGSSTW